MAENTREFYEYRSRTYLIPALGSVKLSELTAEHLEGLYRDLSRGKRTPSGRPLAPSTVGNVHATARAALGPWPRRVSWLTTWPAMPSRPR